MTPIVLTYTTDPTHPGMDALRHSCKSWGWRLREVAEPEWHGWGHRLKMILEAARIASTQGYTHAVNVDAFDVVATGPPDELPAILHRYGNPPLLTACEAALWPDSPDCAAYYGRPQSQWWYAHSQSIIDLRQPRPEGFGTIADDFDDQLHLHRLLLRGVKGIALDRECLAIQSAAHCHPWQDWFAVEPDGAFDRIRNKVTGSRPLFLHGNGRTDISWAPSRWVVTA